MRDRLTRCTERLLAALAELETQLENVQTEKDRVLESLREQETSSTLAQERCRELETSCNQLKNEKEEYLKQIAQLKSDSGRHAFRTHDFRTVKSYGICMIRCATGRGYTCKAK